MNIFDPHRVTLIWSALLAGVCPLAANTVHEDESTNGSQVLAAAEAGTTAAESLSVALHLVGFLALIVVLGVLAVTVGRRAPVHAVVAVVAGAAAVAVKISEAMTGMALRAYADDLDAATARFVVGLDDAGFVVYGFLYSAAFAAIGLGLLRTGPTWLGWWAVGAGMLGVVTAGLGVVTGDYIPVPFLLLLLWLVALGIAAARNPTREPSPVPQ